MTAVEPLAGVPACALGESPFWHPREAALYWVDIPGRALHRWSARDGAHRQWPLPTEPGCVAPLLGGGLLLALRDGLWHFDAGAGLTRCVAKAPYDTATQRFNDGKADALGRLWVGTYSEDGRTGEAALYRFAAGRLEHVAGGIGASNGLAWSPDGRTMYWADTRAHVVYAFDFDVSGGTLSRQREFARFAPRDAAAPAAYGGRPDGAAVDADGGYWIAMYEGARLLRFAPDGTLSREVPLPVRSPTMPCFGDDDLKTLYVTTARKGLGADELAREPWAGAVLRLRVDVPGLPVNFAHA
ncbi:SMP-30/gluconolactonase/LRE family protein [Azohydromonas sediminis]|uniref:SMP-30/gluconolactonase/LRE family protein n=1 Tax=Azohydromonas sediminis TaxID=2259674 RepID=UPI000E65AF12|nr:SMP-30/gluconolactonase/LRE family protein [Azohydromonas sediminis]